MWKALLLFAFAAGVILVAADDTLDESATVAGDAGTADTGPSQDTTDAAGTLSTSESADTQATEESDPTGYDTVDESATVARDAGTGDAAPSQDTTDAAGTLSTSESADTQADDDDDTDCEPRCREDEVYEDFKDHVCMPLKCSELGFPLKCDQRTPGCICKDNKIRSDDGCCVSVEECPSCGGDPNAKKGCGSNCGKTCATYKIKPTKCPISCLFNGCDCKDGFVYDPNVKKCVLPSDCTPTCGANEVYSTCINGGCDARNCSQVDKPVPCVKLDPKSCIKGCVCASGFLRASNGTCVPKDQCGNEGCGGDPNAESGCGVNCGRTCTTYKSKSVACPDICKVGGCDCKKGFVFDDIVKKCVLPADCSTPSCPEGEIYEKCPTVKCDGDYCPKTRDSPQTCPVGIVCDPPRCVCSINSFRDRKTGKCIPTEDCPPFACNGPNEEYQPCPATCPGEKCSDYTNNSTINSCTLFKIGVVVPCKPQCRCKKGYYRNDDNVCIPGSKCATGSCGGDPNAKPGCGVNCGKTCSTYKIKKPFCPLFCKVDGCDCKDGFVFDPNQQKCVPPEECTPTCGANEMYSTCINGVCFNRACSQLGQPPRLPCVKLDPKLCIKGCLCATGYLRLSNGTCVPTDQCGVEVGCGGDPNAEPGCGVNCGRTCTTYKSKSVACPAICKVGGCDCKAGFVFDPYQQTCVPPEDCTPTCGLNEQYSPCTNVGCSAQNCSQAGKPVPCAKINPKYCIKGCVCATGYLRASNGTCVPKDQCGGEGGCGGDPNAEPGCGVNCGRTCTTYNSKSVACPDICKVGGCDCKKGFVFDIVVKKCVLPANCSKCTGQNEYFDTCISGCASQNCSDIGRVFLCPLLPPDCRTGCRCNPGFYRNTDNVCIPESECPPRCGQNEIVSTCSNGGCGPFNCTDLGKPILCIDPIKCTKGCVCANTYLRAENGTCIPKDQCPGPCGGDPNAKPGCGVNCGKTCSTYKAKNPICPRICKVNGCDCKDGFVFDPNQQICVPPEDCTPTCGLNEVYSACTNGGCDARNCSQAGKPVPCVKIDPKYCIKGCVCATGYLRASNGTCVLKDQCGGDGGCGGDPNAEPGCGVNCGRTCTTYKSKSVACPAICKVGGCDCKKGFVFDSVVKKCVLPADCSKCSGQNEFFDTCISGCGSQNCSDIGKIFHCPRLPAECRTGCRCKPGFYRNTDNVCIPESECPPRCGQNEIVSTCSNGGCGPFNCTDLGKPILCIDPIKCTKGCVCANTYLRAENGTCVPKDQCVGPCGGDPNAKPGCGVNCGKTCSTYKAKNPICPRICKVNGCDCKDGFVFDPNQQICVPPEDCTPTCGLNEQYSACSNGGCSARSCSQAVKLVPCVTINPKYCIKGCVCATGYLRASNGTCVPTDQCGVEVDKCSGQNEFFDTCIDCGSQNCSDIGKIFQCPRLPAECSTGCRCKPGFYRNTDNVCIPESECPKCLNPNEVFDVCPAPCPPRRCDVDDGIIRCAAPPKPGDPACKPGCRCADGYARNAKGICVLRSQCDKPENKCRENEVFNPCTRTCPPQRCGIDPALVLCANPGPEVSCQPGCDCINGYVRNDTDVCIPKDQCPKCTGPNEFFDTCISGCGSQNCSDIGKIFNCPLEPAVCRTGCRCNPGFYRNTDNVCVPESECPKCTGQNEYLDQCKSTCTNQTCNDIGTVRSCPAQRIEDCKPGCSCKNGFLRDANNMCIAESDCQCTRPNEYLEPCAPFLCSNQTCDSIAKPYNCPKIGDCRPQCLCKKGFWRNSASVCVPANECPATCTGPNEYFDKCISDCSNQTCAVIGLSFSCPAQVVCKTGCRCNPGFWRDDDNVCIPENQCPTPPCPEGETYNRCPTVKCEGDYCPKTRDSPLTCPTGIVCDPPRCVCGFNSRRDRKTGKCIATAACPPFVCNGPNEEYKPCPATCPGEKCSDYINNSKCPPYRIGIVVPCKPECRCKTGYYRNDDNICVSGCECGPKNTEVTTPPPTTKPSDGGDGDGSVDITRLQAGIADFTGKFLYDRVQASPGENIIISPYSVFTPLAQLALYAVGVALKQLLAVLHLNSKEEIRSKFPYLVASYEGQTSVNFSQAAFVGFNVGTPPSGSFEKDSVDLFHADTQTLNFADTIRAAAYINSWVANKTNNYITDLVSPDMFSADTRIALVNAIAFQGTWLYQFNEKNTQDQPFYLEDGTNKTTKLMYQEANFNYGEFPEYGCKVLEMWYAGQNFSMVSILPDRIDGVTNLVKTLQNFTIFNELYSSLTSQKVKVWFPKFEIRTSTDLTEILKLQNVDQIFNKTDSGLRDILANQKEPVSVTSAVQKAVLKVNENGSEAYAANAVIITTLSAVIGPTFRADHGFLHYILAKGSPIFCGLLVDP